jgi:hypothetical protein
MTKTKSKIVQDLQSARDNKSPQQAAKIIANAHHIDQFFAVQTAESLGFECEYYPNSIRVYLPSTISA